MTEAIITSPQNPQLKHLKQLASAAKWRRRHGQTIIDGIHLCQSYLMAGHTPELCIITPEAKENQEIGQILNHSRVSNVDLFTLSPGLFNAISPVEKSVGIMMVIAIPGQPDRAPALLQSALLLDDIQDPGNVGTMLRTAAAAEVGAIYSSPQTVDIWSPKVLRAGMGAHFNLDIYTDAPLAQLIQQAKIPVLATSLEGQRSLYDTDLTQPTAWLLGNEGRGVSEELLRLDVEKVIIPQNPQVESLNVAAATAVCLFEQRRQRLYNDLD